MDNQEIKQSNYSKIVVGWIVFITGILIIAWTLLNSYNIFTMKAQAPEFFTTPNESVAQTTSGDMQEQIEIIIKEQLKGMIPVDAIPVIFNLAIWSILAFILVFGGGQIASLGIKMISK